MKTILGGMLMAALIATSAEAAVRTEKVEYARPGWIGR